ncbi:MAG TPA: hypothetical protein VL996_01915 [Methylocella sp.]|nr:hypothetical protein [Methylocella sp.]
MDFVELDRSFVPLSKDQEPSLDVGRLWGRKIGGWLSWKDLLSHRRVVLLAEASSGKSEEFRHQTDQLNAENRPAFYVRIEELADQGFESALDLDSAKKFEQWRVANNSGWFFLDSIDEARLNRKSFETALKHFKRDLGESFAHAHILISCRVTDWKGREDHATISRWLPAWDSAVPLTSNEEGHNALLDPIFLKKSRTSKRQQSPELKPNELIVVQLVKLSSDQYRALAVAAGVKDVDAFVSGIEQNALEEFTERPGDLLDLAYYWISHERFGTLAQMTAHAVERKLKELDAHRPDNEALSLTKAVEGAERLAAALTLGKSFTLRVPSHDPDPFLTAGALDPSSILDDWTDAERNALLRRAIFAPATYGRVRFHHRSTQEYLTARWLHRLLMANCPRSEIWSLIFAERYGVETIAPSLRPAAAWLSLDHPDIRDEIIRREPLTLLRFGDPGSLPIDARKGLLIVYAAKHAAAEISDDSMDHRALWMFADQRLETAIRQAWNANCRVEFRLALLRLICEGAIKECADLARKIVIDQSADDYLRIVAVQALKACDDDKALRIAAKFLMAPKSNVSARLTPAFANILYPKHLSTDALLKLIARTDPQRRSTIEGFACHISALYDAAPDAAARAKLLRGLADLCLAPPFIENYQRISKRHHELARNLYEIGLREVRALGNNEPSLDLVRLVMAIERSDQHNSKLDDGNEKLHELIRANSRLIPRP